MTTPGIVTVKVQLAVTYHVIYLAYTCGVACVLPSNCCVCTAPVCPTSTPVASHSCTTPELAWLWLLQTTILGLQVQSSDGLKMLLTDHAYRYD